MLDGLLISGRDVDTGLPTVWTIANGYRSLAEHLGDFGISFAPPTATTTPLGVASGDGSVFVVLGEKWVTNVRPVNYVSLGDSFSSGEGVPPYADTNNDCHRSEIAYSSLAEPRSSTKTLRGLADPGTGQPGFTWSFVACSGAVTNNVRAAGEGQYPGTADAAPQLAQGVVDSATDLVTISIGGNDARFTKVAKACLFNSDCRNTEAAGVSGVTWAEFLPTHINTTVKQAVKAVYQEIKTAAPNAAVVALGYPRLVSGIECSDLLGFSAEEQAFIREKANHLNEVMNEAADEVGIHFLRVARAFSNNEICSANSWLHGVTFPPVHSLHPNQTGQAAYAAVVNEFLNRTGIDYSNGFFASGLPRNPPPQF